jgi:hypothetical protein
MGRLGSMGRLHSMRRRDDPSSRGEAYDMGDGLTGESYPQATTSWLFMLWMGYYMYIYIYNYIYIQLYIYIYIDILSGYSHFGGVLQCMFASCLPALEVEVLTCWVYSLAPHTVASNEKCHSFLFWNADFTWSIIWRLGWLEFAEMCRTARTNDAACHFVIFNDLVSRAAFVCNGNKERNAYFASVIFTYTLFLDILDRFSQRH